MAIFCSILAASLEDSNVYSKYSKYPKDFRRVILTRVSQSVYSRQQVILMAQVKPSIEGILEGQFNEFQYRGATPHASRVQPVYTTLVNARRKFVEVSPSFCKLLGYTQEELIGRSYDDFTVPRTSNIPSVLQLFLKSGHMEGIWVLAHRSGTKLFVRYETFLRADGLYESRMELLAAGA